MSNRRRKFHDLDSRKFTKSGLPSACAANTIAFETPAQSLPSLFDVITMAETQAPRPADKPRLISEVDITKYKVRSNCSVEWRLQEL